MKTNDCCSRHLFVKQKTSAGTCQVQSIVAKWLSLSLKLSISLLWSMDFLFAHFLLMKVTQNITDLKRKITTWTGIWTSDLRISSPALYHLSYPSSHASSNSNLPLETDATLARWCGHDTIWLLFITSELILPFTLIWYSNQIIIGRQIHNLCLGKFTLSEFNRKIMSLSSNNNLI